MNIVLFAVVGAAAYVLGVFGFSQIIGSLQNAKVRGAGPTLFTTLFWAAILVGSFVLVRRLVPGELTAYYVGLAFSLLMVLRAGKIR